MPSNCKQARGDSMCAVTTLGTLGHATCISWKDTKPVHGISTAVSHHPTLFQRRNKGQRAKEPVPCLLPLHVYQQNMGGVDLHNVLRSAHYSLQYSSHLRKWFEFTPTMYCSYICRYKSKFAAVMDHCIVNAYIL